MDMKFLTDIAGLAKDDEILQKNIDFFKFTLNTHLKLGDIFFLNENNQK